MKPIRNIGLSILLTVAFLYCYSQSAPHLVHSTDQQDAVSLTQDPLQAFIESDSPGFQFTEYKSEIHKIVKKLGRKQTKLSGLRWLEKSFYFVHRKKLHWYTNYVDLAQLFASGQYDCVTGTALYALIFEELGVDYTIHEFDYHVFLIARVGADSALIESTDALNGFVHDVREISRRMELYGNGYSPEMPATTPVGNRSATASYHVNNRISLYELAGLQYFNLAVKAFNENKLDEASRLIQQAWQLYPSYRIREIKKIFEKNKHLVSSN